MSKRKAATDLFSLDLDEEQLSALKEATRNLPPDHKCLVPVLESLHSVFSKEYPHKRTLPATYFQHTVAAAKTLDIDYKEDDASYVFNLDTEHMSNPSQMSEHFAWVIRELKSSDYVSVRRDEPFSRTVLDLIVVDRLRQLEDKDTFHRLQVSAEVPISIRAQNIYGDNEIIKGRADWVMGYGVDKRDTGSIFIVLEAKPYKTAAIGVPQLLIYMAAVHRARDVNKKTNQSVFGMLSDSKEFKFCVLYEKKKFFVSRPFLWSIDQSTIITYIDNMLSSAIESSLHTTPHRSKNHTINRYREFLGRRWRFGDESDEEKAEEGEDEEEEIDEEEDEAEGLVDVIKSGGRVVMKYHPKQ